MSLMRVNRGIALYFAWERLPRKWIVWVCVCARLEWWRAMWVVVRVLFSSTCSIFMLMSDCVYVNFRHIINFSLPCVYMLCRLHSNIVMHMCAEIRYNFMCIIQTHAQHTRIPSPEYIIFIYTNVFNHNARIAFNIARLRSNITHKVVSVTVTAQPFSQRCPETRISINTECIRCWLLLVLMLLLLLLIIMLLWVLATKCENRWKS